MRACLMASRVLYSVSRDGLGIPVATHVNEGGTPFVSLVATGRSRVAFLATGTFETMIAIAAFFFVADYTLSFVAVFRAAHARAERHAAVSRGRTSVDDGLRARSARSRSWRAP